MNQFNAAAVSSKAGLAISEEVEEVEDRGVNFVISRNDEGCDIAYNQIPAVSSNVDKVVYACNTGITVNSIDRKKFADDIRYLMSKKYELNISRHMTTSLTCRELYGTGAFGIRTEGGKVSDLVDINTKKESSDGYQFNLITNSLTGGLGVTGVDPSNLNNIVVAVQVAREQTYDDSGNILGAGEEVKTYFTNDNIMILGNHELGRIRGQSSVKRILRYAEGLIRLENTVLLLSKRPTQLVYMAGNEKHNLLSCEVPQSYIEAAKGDRVQAKIDYKTARLTALSKEAKKLADGNVLAQVLEYGTDLKSIEVPEGLPYISYIEWFSQQIRAGITGIEKVDRRVVRSRQQEAKVQAELANKSKMEQETIRAWLNNNLTKRLLEGRTATIDDVWYEFEPVHVDDKEMLSRVWLNVSQAIRNYAQAELDVPEKLTEFMGE